MNDNIIETMNDELEIGRWGEAWQRFMREDYPTESAELMNTERWDSRQRKGRKILCLTLELLIQQTETRS